MNLTQKEKLHGVASALVRNVLKVFWIFPLRENRIIFISHSGTQYSCNPKYISQYLGERYPGKFERIFALKLPEKWVGDGEKFVRFLSPRFLYDCLTAKVITSNCGMPTYLPKRKGQFVIDTWHGGGAYKRNNCNLENIGITKARREMLLYKSYCTNMVLSSSAVFSSLVLPDLEPNYKGEVLPCGMPRNDILFQGNHVAIRQKVCEDFGIGPGRKLVLYAPTSRGSFDTMTLRTSGSLEVGLDVGSLLEAARRMLNSDVVLLIRSHHATDLVSLGESQDVVDVSGYPDTQELLCAADMLVSDYSSIIWDYALTKKPCFLFVPDLDYYLTEDRGTYTPVETWPGIVCRSNEELCQAVLHFDEAGYVRKVERYLSDMGSYETGMACEQVCHRIAEVCGVGENA